LNKVVRAIANFVSEDLSNWYIRRNRKRFWGSQMDISKKAVYITTYEVLVSLSKLIAPITPYISEELYRNLTGNESVHLESYPIVDEKLLNNQLEEKMDMVRDLIRLGRNIREDVKIKVREPLQSVYLDGRKQSVIENLVPLIKEELNVKEVVFIQDLSEYMNFKVVPNFKEVGKSIGSKMKDFQSSLLNLSKEEIMKLLNEEDIVISLCNEKINVTTAMVDIRVEEKKGYNVAKENDLFVILNTERTEKLIKEGMAREFVSKVQQLRKMRELNVIDRICIMYNGSLYFDETYIKEETLATCFKKNMDLTEKYDLNGEEVFIDIEVSK